MWRFPATTLRAPMKQAVGAIPFTAHFNGTIKFQIDLSII
jgi:hypothetical protein